MQFYTYVYYDENWQAYYVGKGQDRRRFQRHNVKVADDEHTQLFYFEHEWQAWECEIELIAFYGRQLDGGTLQNVSTGGPGTLGHKQSEETRRKKSIAGKGRVFSDVHRERLSKARRKRVTRPETRAKLSAAMTGERHPMNGKKHTEETKAKMRAAWVIRKQKQEAN